MESVQQSHSIVVLKYVQGIIDKALNVKFICLLRDFDIESKLQSIYSVLWTIVFHITGLMTLSLFNFIQWQFLKDILFFFIKEDIMQSKCYLIPFSNTDIAFKILVCQTSSFSLFSHYFLVTSIRFIIYTRIIRNFNWELSRLLILIPNCCFGISQIQNSCLFIFLFQTPYCQ